MALGRSVQLTYAACTAHIYCALDNSHNMRMRFIVALSVSARQAVVMSCDTCGRYYYNQWTRQRIHLTLLELQLASLSAQDTDLPPSLPSSGKSSTTTTITNKSNKFFATSTSSTRGRLLLDLLSAGGDNTPLVTAAAAAAGFHAKWMSDTDFAVGNAQVSRITGATCLHLTAPTPEVSSDAYASQATTTPHTPSPASRTITSSQDSSSIAAAQTAKNATPEVAMANSSAHISELQVLSSDAPDAPSAPAAQVARQLDCQASTSQKQQSSSSSQRSLQLPEAVIGKLLSMDAGDLDLMLQHPCALQAQVYELLDVLQVKASWSCACNNRPCVATLCNGLYGAAL